MKLIDRGPGHLRVGRLLLVHPVRQGLGTPVVDGCRTSLTETDDDGTVLSAVGFGGVALRPWRSPNALAVTWRGRPVPNPARWRPRYLLARLRWLLAGRPAPVPMTPTPGAFQGPVQG